MPSGATGISGWLPNQAETLAERLVSTGYETYLFSTNPFVSAAHNLAQGFQFTEHSWDDTWGPRLKASRVFDAYRLLRSRVSLIILFYRR